MKQLSVSEWLVFGASHFGYYKRPQDDTVLLHNLLIPPSLQSLIDILESTVSKELESGEARFSDYFHSVKVGLKQRLLTSALDEETNFVTTIYFGEGGKDG